MGSEVVGGIKPAQFIPGDGAEGARAVGDAFQGVVVECDQNSIGSHMEVGFHVAITEVYCSLKGYEGVLGPKQAAAAVGYRQRRRVGEVGAHARQDSWRQTPQIKERTRLGPLLA